MFGMGAIKFDDLPVPEPAPPQPSAEIADQLSAEVAAEATDAAALTNETVLDLLTPAPDDDQTLLGAPVLSERTLAAATMLELQRPLPDTLAATGQMTSPSAPVAQAPAPVAKAPAPVAKAPAPVAKAPAPVAKAPAPVAKAAAEPVVPAPAKATIEPIPRHRTPSVIVDSALGREAEASAKEIASMSATLPEEAPAAPTPEEIAASLTLTRKSTAPTAPADPGDGKKKPGFRETMWFMDALDPEALGEIENEDDIQHRNDKFEEVAKKKVDEEERRKFSLNIDDTPVAPKSTVRTARVDDEGGIGTGLIIAVVAILAAVGIAAWFVLSGT